MSAGGPAHPSAIGRTIGSYRILEELGRGAMGIVYLGEDVRLHRKVALKALSAPLAGHTQGKERLRREARAAAALAHPGIATVFALEEQGDELFVVSEYVRGRTLRHVMASGAVSAPDVLHIATQVAHALAAVHRSGMLHRDLKPENIMWCDDGGVKILDLGLAHFDSRAAFESLAQLTADGVIVGTPAYMSPEQLEGNAVDFRTDLFSFGIVLYELATGTHPFFRGSSAAFLSRLMAAEYVPLLLQPKFAVRRLERVVERCLRKDPGDRFESTDALVDMLESLATGRGLLGKLFGRQDSRRSEADTRKPSSARHAIDPRAEQSVPQANANPDDVTRESPGGRSVVPVAAAAPTSPTAFGRYAVRRSIGAGGFGEVYLGHDTVLDRPVAIKVLHAGPTPLLDAEAPALQEARALAHLHHAGIVAIHDVGVRDGRMYVVSDYLEGPDLGRWLRDNHPPWAEAVRIVAAVAGALSHAHARLIVHRDVKPANIIVTDGVAPVLVDFGLALDEKHARGGATGRISGTPWYMSPEQAEGAAHRIDGRTDVYSLGVVLYEMLTGRVPFRSTPIAELIRQVREDEPQPPRQLVRDIPVDLERVCLKALAKRQADRYSTAGDFAEDLQRVLQASASPVTAALAETPPMPTAMVARADVLSPAARFHNSPREVSGWRRKVALSAIIAAVALIVALTWFVFLRSPGEAIDSVAVLPFVNMGDDPDTEYLSDGITESLINNLSQLRTLRVSARSIVFRYKGKDADPRTVGRDLGVRAVLSGRLLQRDNRMIVRTELVDVADGAQLWGHEYSRAPTDVFGLQEQIAWEISEKLRPQLTKDEQQQLTKRHTEDAMAYELYLRGRYHWNKRNVQDNQKAADYFNQAIVRDPRYALAYAGLADAYMSLSFYNAFPPRDAIPKASAAASKALDIDRNLADAHISLAYASFAYDWDWPAATRHFERAKALNASAVENHSYYPLYLTVGRRPAEAIRAAERALAQDPLSAALRHNRTVQLALDRQYDAAIEEGRRTIELDPTYAVAYQVMASVYGARGMYEEALPLMETATRLNPSNAIFLALLAYVHGNLEHESDARRILEQLSAQARQRYIPAFAFAVVHLGLDEKDQAFAWLEKAYDERENRLAILAEDPVWDRLRSDPRFDNLLRRVGLPR